MNQQNDNKFGSVPGINDNINPLEYPAVTCTECGSEFFIPVLMFRRIPGSLFGNAGSSIQYPMKVFVCKQCGALSPDDQAVYDDLVEKAKNKQNTSKIII